MAPSRRPWKKRGLEAVTPVPSSWPWTSTSSTGFFSGIAGPTGGSKNKPIGTVVIGICDDKNHKMVDIYNFNGTREEVQIQAAKTSLKEILKFIQKSLDK
jgi:nicotinamide mononucleotide (NMN) deamidase PncC